jgi:hypothetical protein
MSRVALEKQQLQFGESTPVPATMALWAAELK